MAGESQGDPEFQGALKPGGGASGGGAKGKIIVGTLAFIALAGIVFASIRFGGQEEAVEVYAEDVERRDDRAHGQGERTDRPPREGQPLVAGGRQDRASPRRGGRRG